MNITLKELSESFAHLGKFAQIEPGQGITAKQAYWISRIAEAAESEMKRMEKQRIALVKQFGRGDDNGNHQVIPEQAEAFGKAFEELLDVEIELPGDPIKFSDLGENIKLSGLDLLRLRWLIKGEEEPAEKAQAASGD